ncbi:MAG: hypothetical protein ACLP7A_10175 [Desulfobaccales bacterium]
MSWLRLPVLAFLITLFIFAGVASGQGSYELQGQALQPLQNDLPEQGPQPLQNDLPEQGTPLLQSDLPTHRRPGLGGAQSTINPNAKLQQESPRATGIQKGAKGANSKGYSFGPDSFGPASGHHGIQQGKGGQLGVPSRNLGMGNDQVSSPGSTSFLDGYLLNSLHENELGRETPGEGPPQEDLPLSGETSSNF